MAKGQTLKYQLLGGLLAFLFTGSCLIVPLSVYASDQVNIVPKITEIYPNGPGSSELGTEFIELANLGTTAINLGQYSLQIKDKPTKILNLSGTLTPQTYKAFITPFSLVNNGEVVQLVHSNDGVIEEVSYGSGATEEQAWSYFSEGWELAPITKDTVNQRYHEQPPEEEPEEPEITDVCPATPQIDSVVPQGYSIDTAGNCVQVSPPVTMPMECAVEISEISAQPNYNEQEFVELYNPSNTTAHLDLCRIKVNTTSEKTLPNVVLAPGEYFIYTASSGTIKNSAGTITMIRSNGVSLLYAYPETTPNQTVIFRTGSSTWEVTNQPTPGRPNEQSITAVSENDSLPVVLADCGPGRYRSTETNRCRNIEVSEANLTPCITGQERNPETNRCRKIATAATALKPCEPGQERNPETNRCRKISTINDLKPCEIGQERNPETNRCRKIATTVSGTPLEGVGAPATINPFKYKTPVIAFVVLVALGYGVYEYRSDLKIRYQKIRESIRHT